MKFWTCPCCHAHLDIGERCDCQKDKEQPIVTVVRNTEAIDESQNSKKG